MAKYIGSPWGIIKGKLGPAVGYRVGGKNIVRVNGHWDFYKGSWGWIERGGKVNVKQLNLRQVMGIVSRIGNEVMESIIRPVWDVEAKRIRYWDGIALFCKRNVSFLYNSIPQRGSYITPGNKPDLRRLRLTEGVVEFARITGARYSGDKIFVNWETRRYMYGEGEDDAHLFAIYWEPFPLKGRLPHRRPWISIRVWGDARLSLGKRVDGRAILEVESGLNPEYLTVYLAFSRDRSYSISVGSGLGEGAIGLTPLDY